MEPSHYGPFPYTPINRRPKLSWPNGARVAVWRFFHGCSLRTSHGKMSPGCVMPGRASFC